MSEHSLELETANVRLEGWRFGFDVPRSRFVVLAFGELQQLGGVGDPLRGLVYFLNRRGEPGPFATELLGALLVLPDCGVFQLTGYFFETLFLLVVLKETPEGSRYAPRDPLAGA